MEITSLKSTYIQKSRIYLYPLLEIRRGNSIVPTHTYMTWGKMYSTEDCKLITVYHLRNDKEFKNFEEEYLLGNHLFENFFEIEDNKGVYIFDFSKHKKDYKKIVNGKYSELSDIYKLSILQFFKNHKTHHAYIESYLYPEKYFRIYAKLLRVKVSLLKKVGELCDLPDLEKESLGDQVKIIEFQTL